MESDLLTQTYETTAPETRLGQLRSTLTEDSTDTVLVVDDGIEGAVAPRDLLRSRLSDDAQVRAVMDTVPQPGLGTDPRKLARVLVESEATAAPVVDEGGTVQGVVTRETLLRAVLEDLDAVEVDAVQTEDPVTVDTKTEMGEVINELRERGISRVPVVDDGELVGIATTSDLVEFVVRGTDTADRGDRGGGEKPHLVELPVENVMSRPAETTEPSATLREAVERMLDSGYDGLPVVDDSDAPVVGMVTKADALRALTADEREAVEVELVNPDYLRATERDEVAERIADIVEQYRELSVVDARVTFQRHEEDHRGDSLVRCEARLFTDADQVAGTAEEYGADNALRSAMETLERNVLELKGKRTESEQPDGTPPAAERSGEELSETEELSDPEER